MKYTNPNHQALVDYIGKSFSHNTIATSESVRIEKASNDATMLRVTVIRSRPQSEIKCFIDPPLIRSTELTYSLAYHIGTQIHHMIAEYIFFVGSHSLSVYVSEDGSNLVDTTVEFKK